VVEVDLLLQLDPLARRVPHREERNVRRQVDEDRHGAEADDHRGPESRQAAHLPEDDEAAARREVGRVPFRRERRPEPQARAHDRPRGPLHLALEEAVEGEQRAHREEGPEDVEHPDPRLREVEPFGEEKPRGEQRHHPVLRDAEREEERQNDPCRAEDHRHEPPAERDVPPRQDPGRDEEHSERRVVPHVRDALARGLRAPDVGVGVPRHVLPSRVRVVDLVEDVLVGHRQARGEADDGDEEQHPRCEIRER